MKRLSLAELKEQSEQHVTSNLEAVKGGDFDWCHFWDMVNQALNDVGQSEGFGPGYHEFR